MALPHQFQNNLESWFDTGILELSGKSCEMIADDLYRKILNEYGDPAHDRELCIEVSEDGECGSECYYTI